ncbi:MAG: hypothetical protein AAGC63_09375, partial [Propionicimonas sp.]
KRDANAAADAPISPEQVVGVVWYVVPMIGWVATWKLNGGIGLLIPLAGCLFLGYGAWSLISWLGGRGRRSTEMGEAGQGKVE